MLWDLRPIGLTGSKAERICDIVGIIINKNAVSGDTSAHVPGGIRLGTAALTSRNLKQEDIKKVAAFLDRAIQIALKVQKEAGHKLLKDFERVALHGDGEGAKAVKVLRKEVRDFARQFPLPGVDLTNITKPEGIEEED